jgi:quercetin dioxygenase-like cupin family protein
VETATTLKESSMKHFSSTLPTLTFGLLAASLCSAQSGPQPNTPLFASKPIITSPVTGDDKKQMVLIAVAIQPTGAVPWHTHPGDCVGTVIEGVVDLLVEGQPPRRIAAGETYSNLRGTIHGFRNAGEVPAKLLNSLFVDKGVPFVIPAASTSK